MRISDWSSDVCSSDLSGLQLNELPTTSQSLQTSIAGPPASVTDLSCRRHSLPPLLAPCCSRSTPARSSFTGSTYAIQRPSGEGVTSSAGRSLICVAVSTATSQSTECSRLTGGGPKRRKQTAYQVGLWPAFCGSQR